MSQVIFLAGDLKKHRRMHTHLKDTPYPCDRCNIIIIKYHPALFDLIPLVREVAFIMWLALIIFLPCSGVGRSIFFVRGSFSH